MPFLAKLPESGMAINANEVGDKFTRREDLECPYCEGTVRYRRAATDEEGNFLRRAHFWHIDNVGGHSGGGGCARVGESEEHEQWKIAIGDRLRQKYDVPEFTVEKTIGDKQADVAITAPNGGLNGIVAEYQHKNKSKDYIETTLEYLRNGYGVHWIFNTSEDFDMLFTAKEEFEARFGNAPYFGQKDPQNDPTLKLGELVKPWPYAVPEPDEWGGDEMTGRNYLGQLIMAHQRTEAVHRERTSEVSFDPRAEIPARLPDEFFDWLARSIMRDYGWDNMFSPPEDYTDIWCYSKVPATLPPEWHEEKAREFWKNEPWVERFWLTVRDRWFDPILEVENEANLQGDIPLNKWIVEEAEDGYYKSRLMATHETAANMDDIEPIMVHCVDCRTIVQSTMVGGPKPGMVRYSTIEHCQNCGDEKWHTAALG